MSSGQVANSDRDAGSGAGDRFAARALVRTHFRFGWWSLLAFLLLGLFLDALHGFKAGFYLDASSSTRRLLWTLAHAHGSLLALVHIALAVFVQSHTTWPERPRLIASRALMGASILLPAGFFFGGLFTYDGDPGLLVYLVPVGAGLLLLAVFLAALASWRTSPLDG